MKNILSKSELVVKIGVLEISTRACKLLVADIQQLTKGFHWPAFYNEASLTNTGHLLNQHNIIPWNDFQIKVLPAIQQLIQKSNTLQVQHLCCVTTAALRRAKNRDEIIENIKRNCDIEVQILTQEEEAQATMYGFQWISQGNPQGKVLLVDQGGGSTEISAFTADFTRLNFSTSTHIPFGTTSIIEEIFRTLPPDRTLKSALQQSPQLTQPFVLEAALPLHSHTWSKLIGVGSAITSATKKKGNKKQHGMVLSKNALQHIREERIHELSDSFETVKDLQQYLHTSLSKRTISVQEKLVSCVGLGMIIQIMEQLQFEAITINGVGLRYGVCYQYIKKLYPKWNDNSEQYEKLFLLNAKRIGHLIEGTWVEGSVDNIHPKHGVFVNLGDGFCGLIHMRRFYSRKKNAYKMLKKGQTIRVFIEKVHMGDKARFTLTLWK